MAKVIDPMFTKMPPTDGCKSFIDTLDSMAWYANFTDFLIVEDASVAGGYVILSEFDTQAFVEDCERLNLDPLEEAMILEKSLDKALSLVLQ